MAAAMALRSGAGLRHHHPRRCSEPPAAESVSILGARCKRRQPVCVRAAILQEDPTTPSIPRRNVAAAIDQSLRGVAEAGDPRRRAQYLLDLAARMPRLPPRDRIAENRVMGCAAQVWITAALQGGGAVRFGADSESELTRGFCAVVWEALDGAAAEEILDLSPDSAAAAFDLGVPSRTNTWYNVLLALQKRVRVLIARRDGGRGFDPFPSLVITAEEFKAEGSFAAAQARYLRPDAAKVEILADHLVKKRIGVVAHFYMDPEVQGVLVAAQKLWPHIHISDSLVMADRAVKMAEAGCEAIAVLGVDFMSENARAILDQAGYSKVPVYRMSQQSIGCSLAEAADSPAYSQFLDDASANKPALHVIYINTSLETKARAHALVPTITCTSSNVVQTVLQAFAEIPDLTVWYGPDTYMGANLAELFHQLAIMEDEDIAAIHPLHNRGSIASLLARLHYFNDGSCIVHDMFGKDVVARVREGYSDAYHTAHFEVPGEMFSLAMEAKRRGMGVVGSTQNILDFIRLRVQEAINLDFDNRLQFVLGTESGMITAIAAAVQGVLRDAKSAGKQANVEVEIVFPVSSDAVTTTEKAARPGMLTVVPGVTAGEGCSLHGGCASCPYMKMNSLDALLRVCQLINTPEQDLLATHKARNLKGQISGQSVADLGCAPILYMRHFQSHGNLPDELKRRITLP